MPDTICILLIVHETKPDISCITVKQLRFWTMFPDIVTDKSCSHKSWKQNASEFSATSLIGATISREEKMLVCTLIKQQEMGYPLKLVRNTEGNSLKDKPRLIKMWGYAQCMGYYDCIHEKCEASFQVRRMKGYIAVYMRGAHQHDIIHKQKQGLPIALKRYASHFASHKSGAKKCIASLSLMDDHSRSMLGVCSMDAFIGNSKLKISLNNYLKYHRKMNKENQQSFKSVLDSLPSNQADLIIFLNARMKTIDDICSYVNKGHWIENNVYPYDIIVLAHDVDTCDDGRWTHIVFMPTQVLPHVKNAAISTTNRK